MYRSITALAAAGIDVIVNDVIHDRCLRLGTGHSDGQPAGVCPVDQAGA
jgi:hypothetical protein